MLLYIDDSPFFRISFSASPYAQAMPPPLTPPPIKKSKLGKKKKSEIFSLSTDIEEDGRRGEKEKNSQPQVEMDASSNQPQVEMDTSSEQPQEEIEHPKGEKEKNSDAAAQDDPTLKALQVI